MGPIGQPDEEVVAFEDIRRAAGVLRGVVHRTPIITSRQLDSRIGGAVFLKCESLQRTGAFKIRGAYYAMSRLSPSDRERGVLTYSSGNHAQAVALAGSLLGISTTIIMPEDAPAIKRAATEGYGGRVVPYDRHKTSREALAKEMASAEGYCLIPPYDHPDIVAGQGTAGLELCEDAGPLDQLVVCCGGGGLLSGCAIAAKSLLPGCRVVGVEPEAGDDATRSFRTGTLQSVENPDTIADGARTPYLGRVTFPLVLRHVDDMVTVSDDALIAAMRFAWERLKLVMEPTGVLALAALLSGVVPGDGQRTGVLISGGNVDPALALRLIAGPPPNDA